MFRGSKRLISIFVFTGLVLSWIAVGTDATRSESTSLSTQPGTSAGDVVHTNYGKLPLIFEENRGQIDDDVAFVARVPGYTAYLTPSEAAFSLQVADEPVAIETHPKKRAASTKAKTDVARMHFFGANPSPRITPGEQALTRTNYYIGKERFENVRNFKYVTYDELYNGIDAVFYGNASNQLEYDFVVEPNARPSDIRLAFEGANTLSIGGDGELIVTTANTKFVQQKPMAYQTINGEKIDIEVKYAINVSEVTFVVGDFDPAHQLVIDPALLYLTYLGGSALDKALDIEADSSGNAYVAGTTKSLDFHGDLRDSSDSFGVYIAKINADGTQFEYITILEGNGPDLGLAIALDSGRNAYVTGTASGNFPTTAGAYDTHHGLGFNSDAFVAKLNVSGAIVYASYLGGADIDQGLDIAVDANGRAFAVGNTLSASGFPKKNQFQGCGLLRPGENGFYTDGYLTVFNSAGSDIEYSTCIGGSIFFDSVNAVALDAANNVYVAGFAGGGNFPTKSAAQPQSGGGGDAWIARFNTSRAGDASLIYSTYLGGNGDDEAFGIAVSSNGTATVVGITASSTFPLLNAFDSTNQISEAFIAQYSSGGTKLNATFLGGADEDQALRVALGNGGTIHVTGETLSNNFPTAAPFQATRSGARDAFVAKVRLGINSNPGVSSASYLGGSGDDVGNGITVRGPFIYVVGETQSSNLLTTLGVVKRTSDASATNPDAFVAKILDSRKETIGTFDPVNTIFNLRNTLTSGAADLTVNRGVAGDVGVAGDFNGDGFDTVSTFNNGIWTILNFNVIVSGYAAPPIIANFGLAGDLPVVGDWDGDGLETIGTYRPSAGQFFLSNSNAIPAINAQITFGIAEDLPIAGDWNGDGIDTVGVFRPSVGQFFLTNQNIANPPIDITAFFGTAGDLPVGGDWDGDGRDSIGVWRPSSLEFFLSNDNINIANQFVFGALGDTPVVGDWDGRPNQ